MNNVLKHNHYKHDEQCVKTLSIINMMNNVLKHYHYKHDEQCVKTLSL
jgi:hypothetical protein